MTFYWIILAVVVPQLTSTARIQLIDITPEEAQKLITQQSLDLRYATKLSEGSAVGRSYNGKIIDSDDYAEEIYEANQFHGQDGLGRAIFGYTDNQQSRLEARNANGEVRGQYQYLDPWGKDVQVQYWVDSLGFHQNDNLPRYELQPVTDTPEVKAARLEHERLWKEAARLNGVDPDTNDLYSGNADKLDNNNYDNDEELEGQVSNQHQSLARYPVLPYSQHIAPDNAKSFGKVVEDSVVVESRKQEARARFARQQQNDIDEVTSEPRGFFYSFDYQVPFIVDRNAQAKQGLDAQASEHFESSIDLQSNDNNILIETDSNEKHAQRSRVSERIVNKLMPEDEIHDTQASPKQRPIIITEDKVSNVKASFAESASLRALDDVLDVQVRPKQSPISVSARKVNGEETDTSLKQTINRGRGSVKFTTRAT